LRINIAHRDLAPTRKQLARNLTPEPTRRAGHKGADWAIDVGCSQNLLPMLCLLSMRR